jgi:hypothetical protein
MRVIKDRKPFNQSRDVAGRRERRLRCAVLLFLALGACLPSTGQLAELPAFSLVALVPRPRVNLTRYHGVLVPNSKYRARVTPARRGKGKKIQAHDEKQDQTPAALLLVTIACLPGGSAPMVTSAGVMA